MINENKDEEIQKLKEQIKELENNTKKKNHKFYFFLVPLIIFLLFITIFFINKNNQKIKNSETTKENTEISKTNETTPAEEDKEVTDVAQEQPQYQNTIDLDGYSTWAVDYSYMPNCRAPVEAYFDENTGIGKIKYTKCVFNPDVLKNDSGDPRDEYLWLTIKFFNLTQDKFDSLKNLEYTFFDPDAVIYQVEDKFYEYHGAWITNQELNGVNYESFKSLKF